MTSSNRLIRLFNHRVLLTIIYGGMGAHTEGCVRTEWELHGEPWSVSCLASNFRVVRDSYSEFRRRTAKVHETEDWTTKLKWNWVGHIVRRDVNRLTVQIYRANMFGGVGRDRPWPTYLDQIDDVLKTQVKSLVTWIMKTLGESPHLSIRNRFSRAKS